MDDDDQAQFGEENKLHLYLNICARLHALINRLGEEEIPKNDIIVELTDTAEIMELFLNEPNFFQDDEMLLNLDPGTLPSEIKEWISSTFTSKAKPVQALDRLTFKAIVNIILGSVVMERIFKKSTQTDLVKIPPLVSKMLENCVHNWNFNSFHLEEFAQENSLRYLSLYLFLSHDILRKFKINFTQLDKFLVELQIGYEANHNPFSNSLHACDVIQCIHYFIVNYKLWGWLSDVEIFAVLFTAIAHNYHDLGVSNAFLVRVEHQLALLYNDLQVRENHNISEVFKLLVKPECNFLIRMSNNDYWQFRQKVIECCLNLGWNNHVMLMRQVKGELNMGRELDKVKVMNFLLHAADMSFLAKDNNIHVKWIECLTQEMYRLGDMETDYNLQRTPMCSRDNIYKNDFVAYFMIHIADPLYHLLGLLIREIENQSLYGSQYLIPKSKRKMPNQTFVWEDRLFFNQAMWQRNMGKKKHYSGMFDHGNINKKL